MVSAGTPLVVVPSVGAWMTPAAATEVGREVDVGEGEETGQALAL